MWAVLALVLASGPFVSGLRWRHACDPAAPWIPRDITFAAHGEVVLAAPAGANPGLALYASGASADPSAPDLAAGGFSGAIGQLCVAAGDAADELFVLAQFPDPSASQRRTQLARYSAFTTPFAPAWTHDPGPRGNAPAALALARDGATLFIALPDDGAIRIERIDPVSGAALWSQTRAGSVLRGLALSDDGRRLALSAGTDLWVVDELGASVHHEALALATGALALAGDGRTLAWGASACASVARDLGAGFLPWRTIDLAPNEVTVGLALSGDGSTLALSVWDALAGSDVRFELCDVEQGTTWSEYEQTGSPSGLQNYPSGLTLSADGQRAALGLWGTGDARPEVVLLSRTGIVLEADLPGSVYALDLDEGGTRIAVGSKDAHANLFASTGAVSLFDTGERDLELVAATRVGGELALAFEARPACTAVFGLGVALTQPLTLPGCTGTWWLDPLQSIQLYAASTDELGQAHLTLAIPSVPSLVGYPLAAHAAILDGGPIELARTLVEPILF
jgi:hypothetical protein